MQVRVDHETIGRLRPIIADILVDLRAGAPILIEHEILHRTKRVSDLMRRHMQDMRQSNYNVFVRTDGSYGAVVTELGAIVRSATGFATELGARTWVEQHKRLEWVNDALSERYPAARDAEPSVPQVACG